MRQFDVTRYPAIARQVGVVEHVVVEPVSRQDVALVVGLVERPVVAQALGRQHQHAVVAQFVVLDDGQGFEGFAQTHAVGDDAATKAVQLVDGAHHTVALELEELFHTTVLRMPVADLTIRSSSISSPLSRNK